MKKIISLYVIVITLGAIIFGACRNEPMSKERLGKDDGFEVEYLFDKDGVKVYRFYDNGHYHYFTTKGETISVQTQTKNQTYNENIKDY
jgi:hypothetical protein